MPRLLSTILFLILTSACAHRPGQPRSSSSYTMITKDDLAKTHFATLYEAVEGLRRNWLQGRGPDSFNSPTQVKVYLDNAMLGGVDALRNIAPISVSYLQYFDGISATTRWGTDHGAG